MKILVTGGAGYIGSHTIVDLLDNGFEVVSVDNYTNSDASTFDRIEKITSQRIHNYEVDLCDLAATRQIFIDHSDITGIIHFAALRFVNESVEQPIQYYDNNINSVLNILRCMDEFDVRNLIFSSSCSVYGNAEVLPVTEQTPWQEAECPYARTKQMGEDMIRDFMKIRPNLNSILLRYFNPAGAHESGLLGELPINPPVTLVPIITEVAIGKREKLVVFGEDYDTRDGSCIRDYIHIMDLAHAHTKAMIYLRDGKNKTNAEVFNLGIGEGVTVLEAIHAFEEKTGLKLNYEMGARREGDVGAIYANLEKALTQLDWKPQRDIADIMSAAWAWEQAKQKM